MIAHRNIIANVMQIRWHEETGRRQKGIETQRQIGLLPMSHIYALVVVANTGPYRGDGTIVLPRFELKTFLECIQKYKINFMHLVRSPPPPISNLQYRILEQNSLLTHPRFPQSSSSSCATRTSAPNTTSAARASSTRGRRRWARRRTRTC